MLREEVSLEQLISHRWSSVQDLFTLLSLFKAGKLPRVCATLMNAVQQMVAET